MIEMRKRGLAAHGIRNLDAKETDSARDVCRKQFTEITAGLLCKLTSHTYVIYHANHVAGEHCAANGTLSENDKDRSKFQMKWGVKFVDFALEHKCRFINYPRALETENQIIGTSQFKLKNIKKETFAEFMPTLVKAYQGPADEYDDSILAIVPWEAGTYLLLWRLACLTES